MLDTNNRRHKGYLKIFQANVARGQPSHDLALALARAESADIIILQEPWIFPDLGKKVTKTHADFDTFSPTDHWEVRPRVLTYVRKGRGLQAVQIRPANTADICWVTIMGFTPSITIANVYRPPQETEGGAVICALKEFRVPPNYIVAGDFNTRHPLWDSRATASRKSIELADWAQTNDLVLTSPIDKSTHSRGNTLDLAFTNNPHVQCNIEEHLHTTSDHETLVSIVPCTRLKLHSPRVQFSLKPESIPHFAAGVKETLPTAEYLPQDVDRLTNLITQIIQVNMQRFLPRKIQSGNGTKWWNKECANKAAEYRRARRRGEATTEKHALRKATRAAKKEFWMKKVEEARQPKDIFKITSWHKYNGSFGSPPIKHNGSTFTDPSGKASALSRALLERRSNEEDISLELEPTVTKDELHIDALVELDEIEQCVLYAGNTAPGIDGITTQILRACWDSIKYAVLLLFRRCLSQGHHPSAFCRAEVIFLPKPNKRDLSSPKSWRPIALLSCLGKGLERLMARRISHAAITQNVLSQQQFGALPKRSATDLVGCLVHDIEKARSQRKVASLLTMDIKGAFDTVLPGRLKYRLREQRWPKWLIGWVESFVTNRSARIRIGDFFTQETPLICGLPQGSPVSPILFMLYIEPLISLANPRCVYSYADDIAFIRTGKTLSECSEKLAKDLEKVIEWGIGNAITFDQEKSELQHFTQAPKPKEYPIVRMGDWCIAPNQVTRWLGFWLDRKLSFLTHVKKWAAKASSVAMHLKRLNNSQRGSRPDLVRQAVKSCVIPIATYGAEVWWPGETVYSWSRGIQKDLKNRSNSHLSLLSKSVKLGLRSILPVFKTTPLPILYREAGIPPVNLILEETRLRQALRIQTLDDKHPLKKRALGKAFTRLTRTTKLLPLSVDGKDVPLVGKKRKFDANVPRRIHDIHLFTDGSRTADGKAGGGFVIFQGGRKVKTGSFGIDRKVEPIDTEIIAICQGLFACIQFANTRFATNILVHTDNRTAVGIVNGNSSLTCRKETKLIRDAQENWNRREKLAHVSNGFIFAEWVPGHMGVPANEEADSLAKAGALRVQPAVLENNPSFAAVKSHVLDMRKQLLDSWWDIHGPARYKDLDIQAGVPGKCPATLRIPRKALHHLLSARSGHGDFENYHERFNHTSYSPCICGRAKSPIHFFFCRLKRATVRRYTGKLRTQEAINWLLGTEEGAVAYSSIINGM